MNKLFSLKYGIILIVAIAIASFIGLFIDSIFSTEIAYNYIYCSYWFAFLLVLLFINIIGCSYRNTINKLKLLGKKDFKTDPEDFKIFELSAEIEIDENKNINRISRDVIYHVSTKIIKKYFGYVKSDKNSLYARKGLISRFGGIITHFGILMIIIGVLYCIIRVWFHLSSDQSQLLIAEGEERNAYIDWSKNMRLNQDKLLSPVLTPFGFKVRLIDFDIESFPGTEMPKAYTSIVEFIDGEKKIRDVINMTKTASYKGYKFNQTHYFALNPSMSSKDMDFIYQIDGEKFLQNFNKKRLLISLVDESDLEKKFDVGISVKEEIPNTNYSIVIDKNFVAHIFEKEKESQGTSEIEKEVFKKDLSDNFKIRIDEFFSNFSIEKGEGKNLDNTFNNPAIKYTVFLNNKELYSDYAFNKEELRDFSTKDGIFNVEFESYSFDKGSKNDFHKANIFLNLKNRLNDEELKNLKFQVGIVGNTYMRSFQEEIHTPNPSQEGNFYREGSMVQDIYPALSLLTKLSIVGVEDTYYSVLGVSKVSVFFMLFWYVSFCFVMIGPFIAFFINYRELWVCYDEVNRKIYIGEKSRGDMTLREKWFAKVIKEISSEKY